jgi:hypothetical protein
MGTVRRVLLRTEDALFEGETKTFFRKDFY